MIFNRAGRGGAASGRMGGLIGLIFFRRLGWRSGGGGRGRGAMTDTHRHKFMKELATTPRGRGGVRLVQDSTATRCPESRSTAAVLQSSLSTEQETRP